MKFDHKLKILREIKTEVVSGGGGTGITPTDLPMVFVGEPLTLAPKCMLMSRHFMRPLATVSRSATSTIIVPCMLKKAYTHPQQKPHCETVFTGYIQMELMACCLGRKHQNLVHFWKIFNFCIYVLVDNDAIKNSEKYFTCRVCDLKNLATKV